MNRETNLRSRRNIDVNLSEYRPIPVNYEEIKKIRKRENINNFLNSSAYLLLLLLFSIYALFSDDFRILVANNSTDSVFFAFTIITFIFFALDICSLFYFKRKYIKSLGIWLDVASALTILLDIGWIYYGFYNSSESRNYALISPAAESSAKSQTAQVYLYTMRYVRLLRLNGILKFIESVQEKYYKKREKALHYKRSKASYLKESKGGSDFSDQDINRIFLDKKKFLVYPSFDFDANLKEEFAKRSHPQNEPAKGEVKNSSRDFSNQNVRRVIYLILILIVFIPLFIIESYYINYEYPESSLQSSYFRITHPALSKNPSDVLESYKALTSDYPATFVMATIYTKTSSGSFNTQFQLKNGFQYNQTETEFIQNSRLIEVLIYVSPNDLTSLQTNESYIVAIFDNSSLVKKNAALGLGRTLFAIIIILISIFFFYNDARKLLLGPFEEMMIKIKKIEQNPMKAAKETKEEVMALEKVLETNRWKRNEQAEKERYETTVLINTLIKSGELLALGFGEAGTEIIIEKLNDSRKRENNKVICIFGFCDIKHFTEVTDILREDIMMFVNEIAEIISTIVDENTGSTNKNIGEAFLLVWKFRESDIINIFDHDADGEIRKDIKLKEYLDFNNPITSRCELALLSFLQCIIVIHTSPTLNKYQNVNALKDRIPGFKVKMGFGLHIGWAIEGAIGSDHKIDASYLSPNVNLASRLQAATKQFGVNILVSGEIYNLLSPEIKKLLRIVDVVNLKGSKLAMKLYTYDMYLKDIPVDTIPELKEKDKEYFKTMQRRRIFEYRKRIQKIHAEFFNGRISGKKFFFTETSIMTVRKRFKKAFYDIWNEGFNAYVAGDWDYAKINFVKTQTMIKDYTDGPSTVLLDFMQEHDFKAPEDWHGVRHLYNK